MKRFAMLAALAGVLAVAAPANAQNRMMNPDCNIICAPVFVHQHSVILTDMFGAGEDVESETNFLMRFTTAFGTEFNPLFFAFLVQWTPFNKIDLGGGEEFTANTPVLVYGPGFHVLGGSGSFVDMGGGADIFALDLLPLGVYTPSSEEAAAYTHKLVLEADAFLHIGKLLDPQGNAPFLNAISIHGILDYITEAFGTFIPDGVPENVEPSRWVVILGLTIPLAPIPGG
jgi:hypothetical protein